MTPAHDSDLAQALEDGTAGLLRLTSDDTLVVERGGVRCSYPTSGPEIRRLLQHLLFEALDRPGDGQHLSPLAQGVQLLVRAIDASGEGPPEVLEAGGLVIRGDVTADR